MEDFDPNTDEQLQTRLADVRAILADEKHAISDLVDGEGNQYVDLVMEGGGMLGIALVGYTWALEELGIRFLGIGGTSAGSINALLLAALDDPAKPKSPALLEEFKHLNFYDFVDGGDRVRSFIDLGLDEQASFKVPRLMWKGFGVWKRLRERYGLNPGSAFQRWLGELLSKGGVATLADLEQRLKRVPDDLRLRGSDAPLAAADRPRGKLVVVAADITTETRVEFPRMAPLYWSNPEQQSPAVFARASMSIPFFFEPLRINGVPRGPEAQARWAELAGYDKTKDKTAEIPATAMFVDGGIMSNFPIDAFHQPLTVPRCPTFGVKLQYDERYKPPGKLPPQNPERKLKHLGALGGAIFNSARHTLDYEFIKRNPDYKHLVSFIPCTYRDENGQEQAYNWLDFNMSDAHKVGLFRHGALHALDFVERFASPFELPAREGRPAESYDSRWAFYKQLRERMIAAHEAAAAS